MALRTYPILLFCVLAGAAPTVQPACDQAYRVLASQNQRSAGVALEDDRWLRAIMAEAGCELREEGLPVSGRRMHVLLERGEIDVLSQASYLTERLRYAYFSRPYRRERIWLYAGRPALPRFAELRLSDVLARKLVLLVPASGWFGPEFAALRPELARAGLLVEYRDLDQASAQLEAGRAELLLATDSFEAVIAHKRLDVATLATPVYENPVHLMLSRATASLADLERINGAIDRLLKRNAKP